MRGLKGHILKVASTATLRQLAEDFGLEVSDRRKRSDLEKAIAAARRFRPERLFNRLTEQEVKQVCEAAGVDSRGRKNELIKRLLGAPPIILPASPLRKLKPHSAQPVSHTKVSASIMNNKPPQSTFAFSEQKSEVAAIESFEFEPIKGYPMLNWRGKRPFTSTQYYPAQLKEVHGTDVDGWRNKIYWGDNLQVMSHLLREFRSKVDLIYIDPPFDSKADYKKTITLHGKGIESDQTSFEEKQYTDIWTNDEYLQFMYERLVLMRELLSQRGSIYLHCDWRKSQYLRLIMDEIFGPQNFRNEITWVRTASHNDTTGKYSRVKDTILFYSKTDEVIFNTQYTKYDQSYIDSEWNLLPSGRYWKSENMLDPRGAMKMFDFHGTVARWRTSPEKMEELWNAPQTEVPNSVGRIKLGKNGKPIKRCRIMFLDELPGVPLSDNWTDISYVAGRSKESFEYPTQKPEALLQRILKTSTDEGSLVFDCFMGSGTTQAVSMKLGRRFIGADINLGAIQTTTKRLTKVGDELSQTAHLLGDKRYIGFEVYNVNHYDIFRNPIQAKDLLIEALEVQKLEIPSIFDGEKDGRMVKIMPVNRIATRADLNELIAGFDYKAWERRQNESPTRPVERILLVCMGHESDLKAQLEYAVKPFKINVEVVDILRDKANLEFKRDSEAKIAIKKSNLIIERFYPMNLLQKLSLQKETVEDWRELVESILIDWNYDGAVFQPAVVDIPGKNELVQGRYVVPSDAGTIRVKITDLLSESWEGSIDNG
jgi:site-specific DNA-methyltransferase (adenine-specific)/adenine-specific DNA-methyltransferase